LGSIRSQTSAVTQLRLQNIERPTTIARHYETHPVSTIGEEEERTRKTIMNRDDHQNNWPLLSAFIFGNGAT
jgi:hypothetical protein